MRSPDKRGAEDVGGAGGRQAGVQAVRHKVDGHALRHEHKGVPAAGAQGAPGYIVQQERQHAAQQRLPLLLCANTQGLGFKCRTNPPARNALVAGQLWDVAL